MANDVNSLPKSTAPTALLYDEIFKAHETPLEHPESPRRLDAIIKALDASDFGDQLLRLKVREAELEDVAACHTPHYLERAQQDIAAGESVLSTGDTSVCHASWQVAWRAAGAACEAVDAVFDGRAKNAFCAVRPPGHHATQTHGMGFCVLNNVAIAARYAQRKHDVGKVLIVDWDVHHGNGTQAIFYEDGSVLLFNTHQSPWYPGTGARHELGYGDGVGATINRPYRAGAGREEILGVFRDELAPIAERFQPELVLISAGFDSREGDPLGHFRLTDQDFADLTDLVIGIANQHAHGRIVSLLEGGYALSGLASAVTAHCRQLHRAATT